MIKNHFIFIVLLLILFLENVLLSIQFISLKNIFIYYYEVFNLSLIIMNFDLLFVLVFLFYLQDVINELLMNLRFLNSSLLVDLIMHEFLIFF